MTTNDNFPFRNWVPQWAGTTLLLLFFFPIMFISGTYTTNLNEMVGGLGVLSEHIQFTAFCSSVGMSVFPPMMVRYLRLRRYRIHFICGFAFLLLGSFLCANTHCVFVLCFLCFFMGLVRMMLLFNALFLLFQYAGNTDALQVMLNPPADLKEEQKTNRTRGFAIPVIYMIFIVLNQLSYETVARITLHYNWQHVYYLMMLICLICIFFCLITMCHQERDKTERFHFYKVGDQMLLSVGLLSYAYMMVFGKVYDWFDDMRICLATGLLFVSGGLFVYIQLKATNPFVHLHIFKRRNVFMALLMFAMLTMLNSSSMTETAFMGLGMTLDSYQAATIGNWSICGTLLGFVIGIFLTAKRVHIRWIIASGFFLIAVSASYMYFHYQTQGMYNDMKWPLLLRSCGMFLPYAYIAIVGMRWIPGRYNTSWILGMLLVRNVLGPVTGSTIYNNVLNHKTQYYINRLSTNIDPMDPGFNTNYNSIKAGYQFMGKTASEAEKLAAMSTKGRIQRQAVLAALKKISGLTIRIALGVGIIILILPFYKKEEDNIKPAASGE